MAAVAEGGNPRYPGQTMSAHYDREVDIAELSFESGRAVSEEREWGLIDRDPDDGHLMGFVIWNASERLPKELVEALPVPRGTGRAA